VKLELMAAVISGENTGCSWMLLVSIISKHDFTPFVRAC